MTGDYTHLTEIAGSKITGEQLQRMYNRYAFAAELSTGKDVLEVACGVGQGLGLLGCSAKSVVAGDYTWTDARPSGEAVSSKRGLGRRSK